MTDIEQFALACLASAVHLHRNKELVPLAGIFIPPNESIATPITPQNERAMPTFLAEAAKAFNAKYAFLVAETASGRICLTTGTINEHKDMVTCWVQEPSGTGVVMQFELPEGPIRILRPDQCYFRSEQKPADA